jgi:hypothetical protein
MKILRGTIFGGILYFLLGWLVWGILLMDFFLDNTNQCANRPDGVMIWWAMIMSTLLVALLLTLFLNWAKAKSMADGLITGAIFGSLFTATIDLSFWSMTTMYNSLIPILVEIAVSAVLYALVGMVIVLTWGKEKTS